jgi:hypothetical protein
MKTWSFEQWLSIVVVSLIFAFFFLISFYPPEKLNSNIGEVKTALISILTMVVGYWFGSSRSSAKKDDALVANTENKPVVTNADTVNVNSNNKNEQP